MLKLLDLNPADVELTKNGVHAYLKVVSTGDVITLDDQFWSATENWGIEEIRFADGTLWDRAKINDLTSVTRGTSGNDTLSGTNGNDTFDAGKGDDRINSGAGSDTYLYRKGDGSDVIDDENPLDHRCRCAQAARPQSGRC